VKVGENFFNQFKELLDFPEESKLKFFKLVNSLSFSEKEVYLVGGAIRDTVLKKKFTDVDFTVSDWDAILNEEVQKITDFVFVPLSPEFGIYRFSKGGCNIDFTIFKGWDIEADLRERDFTFNAVAIELKDFIRGKAKFLDPFGGIKDLKEGYIRVISEKNLIHDPLRILRGYRFFAQGLGRIEERSRFYFSRHRWGLLSCARERVWQELSYILCSSSAFEAFRLMDEDGVLEVIFPWIKDAKGVKQPSFHHLDVWGHLLEALRWAEEIVENPESFLPLLKDFLDFARFKDSEFRLVVKLASFLHDIGKGYTYEVRDRITFYGHEKVSKEVVSALGKELKIKRAIVEKVEVLVKNHMRPFLLLGEKEKGGISLRAKRNLIRDVPFLEELLVVCMADSLASQGEDKEPDYEERLQKFFAELFELREELKKVEEKKKRLITGHDLIALGLKPGPIFKEILQEVEVLLLEGRLKSKEEALEFVKSKYVRKSL